MSKKPDSIDRRGFFERFLPKKSPQTDKPSQDEKELQPTSLIERRGFISGTLLGIGGLFCPNIARATRFDILELIDPTTRNPNGQLQNLAAGQDPYPFLEPEMQPYLWPSDDVRKKDRHPKTKEDIPSPSIVFETIKLLQDAVKSRHGETINRLKTLEFIRRKALNFAYVEKPKHPLHNPKHIQYKQIYEMEQPRSKTLLGLWGAINSRMESLRKRIKETVILEMNACKAQKRCAKELPDIDMVDHTQAIPLAPSTRNQGLATYNNLNDGVLPAELRIEPFRCAAIDLSPDKENDVTNSSMLEYAKFLEKVIIEYHEAVEEREGRFLQIEHRALGLPPKKKAVFQKIYTVGRKFNEKARTSWTSILREVTSVKGLIAKAEFEQTKLANAIDRCAYK